MFFSLLTLEGTLVLYIISVCPFLTHIPLFQVPIPLFSNSSFAPVFPGATEGSYSVPGCGWACSFASALAAWRTLGLERLLWKAESQESELLGSSPREQGREQKMRPPRGRKGLPSRGSWQWAQQKHASVACQCWPSYVIWPWSMPGGQTKQQGDIYTWNWRIYFNQNVVFSFLNECFLTSYPDHSLNALIFAAESSIQNQHSVQWMSQHNAQWSPICWYVILYLYHS